MINCDENGLKELIKTNLEKGNLEEIKKTFLTLPLSEHKKNLLLVNIINEYAQLKNIELIKRANRFLPETIRWPEEIIDLMALR